jgi:DNA repair protein RadC
MTKYEEENFNSYQIWVRETKNRNKVNEPQDAVNQSIKLIDDHNKEYFIVIALDTKNKVIDKTITSIGCLNSNVVHPREVFKFLILNSAAHGIVLHNHPSGDPLPSREDIDITKKLVESGKILGIDIIDHVIIGADTHHSLKEAGHI